MGKKAGEIEALKTVLKELEARLDKYKENPGFEVERDVYSSAYFKGYINGMGGAITAVQLEIGLRLKPPNINYPGD
jgi:hypothetical protein